MNTFSSTQTTPSFGRFGGLRRRFLRSKAALAICALPLLAPAGAVGQEILNAWNTNGNTGATADGWQATTTGANMATGALSRGSGVTASSLNNGFAASGWDSASLDANKYFQFSVQPATGYAMNLSEITCRTRRSSTGPNTLQWAYSTDGVNFTNVGAEVSGYTNTTDGFTQPAINLSGVSALQSATGQVTFRLYGWGASAPGGTFSFGRTGAATNDLVISGTVAEDSGGPGDPGDPVPPAVGAVSVSSITTTEASLSATFNANDGENFTFYGFAIAVADVSDTPTLGEPGVVDIEFDNDLDPISSPIAATVTELEPATEYAVRAYVIYDNGAETIYSPSVTTFTTAALPPALDGETDYTQNFSGYNSAATLPSGWSITHDGNSNYGGDWGTGTGNGPRGNASVLGFQHTGSTGVAVKTLTLINNTGAEITELTVSYTGRVARATEGRKPAYTVEVDGIPVAALGYSTESAVDEGKSALVTGLSIADGATFTITWSSDRDLSGSGSSRQIGISDVVISTEIPEDIAPTIASLEFPDPADFPITQTGFTVGALLGDAGTQPVSTVGFVLSETTVQPVPVLGDPDTVNVDATGSLEEGFFFTTFSALNPRTTYTVRAYATSAAGTGYSSFGQVTTLPLNASLTTAGYSENFTTFEDPASLNDGWTADSSGGVNAFGGLWGIGTGGGFRGPDLTADPVEGVLGYQHTGTTGTVTITLKIDNNTGEEINALDISYLGRVARVDQTRLPIWTVRVNGTIIPELQYSTGSGVDETVSTTLTGLSIAPGEEIEITWSSDRGESAGGSRQIGIADVSVQAVEVTVTPATLSLASGTFFEGQTVFIANFGGLDPDTEVRYTLDGTDPGFGIGTVYNDAVGIAVPDGNGPVQLRVVVVNTLTEETSPVVSATYTLPTNAVNIAAVRAGTPGTIYRIPGEVVVLHRDATNNRHYVRDDSGSLTIWDATGLITTEYAVGDGVTGFIGTRGTVNSNAIVNLAVSADPGAATSTENPVEPELITLEQLTLARTGDLVRVNFVTFADSGDFVGNASFNVTDATATRVLRTDFAAADYLDTAIPEGTVDIVGIVGGFGANAQITPRSLADITESVLPELDAPVFSIEPGTYFGNQTLNFDNFASYGATVEIRYTLDGSEPGVGTGLVYDDATGITLEDGNGAIEVRAVAVDTDTDETSQVAVRSFTFPVNVADIAALRASSQGGLYRVTGEITFTGGDAFRNTKFFQDASGFGIQIDDNGGVISTTYNVGDNVAGFVGTLGAFLNQLQWVPAIDPGAAVSTGNPIVPVIRTLDTLSSADQGLLVRINGVEFESAGDNFGTGGQGTNITDPSVTGFVGRYRNNFGGSDITGSVIPSGMVDLIGIIQQRDSDFNIAARSLADIILPDAPPADPFDDFVAGAPEGQRGRGDAPAGDGVANVFKFAFGGNPNVSSRAMLPSSTVVEEAGESFIGLAIQLSRSFIWDATAKTLTDTVDNTIVLAVQGSGTLAAGSWAAPVGTLHDGDGVEVLNGETVTGNVTFALSDDIATSGNFFLRVEALEPVGD